MKNRIRLYLVTPKFGVLARWQYVLNRQQADSAQRHRFYCYANEKPHLQLITTQHGVNK